MSVSVGLSLHVSGLQPGAETTRVAEALTAFLTEHDLERDVVVTGDAVAGEVFAGSDYPVIVTGFGRWADQIEQGLHDTVRAIAPAAQADFRWSFEDEDEAG
ncbi:hypothetical protein [Streptomyces curacoi]|uniref:Uncharacterized protein n=1 Tax=Streptomyces curacoi TaxID=146536 RepID=A0A117P7K1_9ACTN|nr:hypothetical protein [Streptomyces curacoi]KUM74509.1 hypothetical protein AQI70_16805 [Streptomyces curacoi]